MVTIRECRCYLVAVVVVTVLESYRGKRMSAEVVVYQGLHSNCGQAKKLVPCSGYSIPVFGAAAKLVGSSLS